MLFCAFNNEIIKIENVIYSLYVNDFYEYLTFDDNYSLCLDEEGLQEYLNTFGYETIVKKEEGNLIIKICFKYIIGIEKEYLFYMVKNDG